MHRLRHRIGSRIFKPTGASQGPRRLALLGAAMLVTGACLPASAPASQALGEGQTELSRTQAAEQRRAERVEERTARREARLRAETPTQQSVGAGAQNAAGEGETTPVPQAPSHGARPAGRSARGCSISIAASARRVTAGETVVLSGALQCASSGEAANQQVPIYAAGAGTHGRTLLATVTTQANGSYELSSQPLSSNTIFQAREGRRGAHVTVTVAPRVTLNVEPGLGAQASGAGSAAHPTRRAGATFVGTVSPAETGALVALQAENAASGTHWRAVAFGRVQADGSYSLSHTFGGDGARRVRTVVRSGHGNAPAFSAEVSYEPAQPQNPALTINASADALSYGQSVTISGVAAGVASGPVTLLARTAGGGFTAVAEASTGADGSYTFTQTPQQNTVYRVSDASTHSTTVSVGVAFVLATTVESSTAQVGQQLSFSGTLASAPVGQLVYLERGYSAGVGFHVLAAGTVDALGQFTITHTFDSAGTNVLRLSVPSDGQHRGSSSAPFTVTVTP